MGVARVVGVGVGAGFLLCCTDHGRELAFVYANQRNVTCVVGTCTVGAGCRTASGRQGELIGQLHREGQQEPLKTAVAAWWDTLRAAEDEWEQPQPWELWQWK